jgi:spore maturation protein SpmA
MKKANINQSSTPIPTQSGPIKSGSTLFLKVVLLLIAVVVFVGMIRFPQTEGRAKNLDLISIYSDPFIIYIYIGSIPFFVGLYQAFKLLNLIDANKAFSQGAVNTLRNMKFASLSLIGFIALALFYIRFATSGDDPAGPTMLGIIVSFAAAVIATAAAVFEKLFQNAVDIKSENDLTV